MGPIRYIELENFKLFGAESQRIDLDHPTVLIGPNNCGKTTVIQALSLWSHAVKAWYESKGRAPPRQRTATSLNRLNIVAVPVRRTRYFWHNTTVRTGNSNVVIKITVGVFHDGVVFPVTMECRNSGEDIVYCTPNDLTLDHLDVIKTAAETDVELLYPLSGLETEEPVIQPGRVKVLLGQGQTAQVLRNLCLMAHRRSATDWQEIVDLIERLFNVRLDTPVENARGSIDLFYRQNNVTVPLDIASAGRGLQQMLLILSYLYTHQGSVLLIDEPDAHLEILRQKQVYVLLREVAAANRSQVVLATHSEQILDEAVDHSLTLLLGGNANSVGSEADTRNALKHYGTEHYLRALQRGYVLYLEGITDLRILRALANKLNHAVASNWDERVNVYYVRDNYPDRDVDAELARVEGGYGMTPIQHFKMIRGMVPDVKGLGVLDRDRKHHQDTSYEELRISYWDRYEIENYIASPDTVHAYVADHYGEGTLAVPIAEEVFDVLISERIFTKHGELDVWHRADFETRRVLWEGSTRSIKLSDFAEEYFRRLADKMREAMLLRKGDLHQLVKFLDVSAIPAEIAEKLDLLHELFGSARPHEGV